MNESNLGWGKKQYNKSLVYEQDPFQEEAHKVICSNLGGKYCLAVTTSLSTQLTQCAS